MCGVSYGEIDVDRLLNALTLVRDPGHRAPDRRHGREGIVRARVAAVREVPDVPERLLASRGAQRHGDVQAARRRRARHRRARRRDARRVHRRRACCTTSRSARRAPCSAALRERRLHKRAFECPAAILPPDAARVDRRRSRAHRRGRERARRASSDSPPAICCSTIRRRRRCSGSTCSCSAATAKCGDSRPTGWEGAINLPKLSEEFYQSARWLRVYTSERIAIDPESILRLAKCTAPEVRAQLEAGGSLLNSTVAAVNT